MTSSGILLVAGSGSRANLSINKTLSLLNNIPVFIYSLQKMKDLNLEKIYIVCKSEELETFKDICNQYGFKDNIEFIIGGKTRNESVRNALKNVTTDQVLIHDGARPLTSIQDFKAILETKNNAATLYHDVVDTIKEVDEKVTTLVRSKLFAVTTPQVFKKELYSLILNNNTETTDEINIVENDYKVDFVKETSNNLKITYADDLALASFLLTSKQNYLIGHSLDYHPYSNESTLILGGCKFAGYPQLKGHSDADVVYHVVAESILGALSKGDLGSNFSDKDPKYLGMDSSYFINKAMEFVKEEGYVVNNIDIMVYLEKPRLADTRCKMIENIKKLTNVPFVSLKAATMNKGGLIATNEGIGSEATVLLKKQNN